MTKARARSALSLLFTANVILGGLATHLYGGWLVLLLAPLVLLNLTLGALLGVAYERGWL